MKEMMVTMNEKEFNGRKKDMNDYQSRLNHINENFILPFSASMGNLEPREFNAVNQSRKPAKRSPHCPHLQKIREPNS